MDTLRIVSNNYNGQSAVITYYPDTGGTINLGTQVLPYDYIAPYFYGTYTLFFPAFGSTCTLYVEDESGNFLLQENGDYIFQENFYKIIIETAPSPTPTVTPTTSVTPSLTPTPTITISITPTPSITPTLSLTPTPSTSVVLSGLVTDNLFMKLDASNYTSGTWSDETGNGNNATINGATWSSTDGGIFDLDGSNDTISVPHVSDLSLTTTGQKTVQVWVKFDTLPALNTQIPVFGKLSSASGFDGYWGGLFSNGGVVRCVTNGTAVQRISTSTSTITTNTWYLFTFISQITSTSNTTKVYINNTEYITAAHGSDSYGETNPFYLGWIGSGVSSLYLNGKIGACYFYTKGLNTSEILTNFNATKTRYGL
jgi:hypothetical protein